MKIQFQEELNKIVFENPVSSRRVFRACKKQMKCLPDDIRLRIWRAADRGAVMRG